MSRQIPLSALLVIALLVFLWGWIPADRASYTCRYQTNAAWISVNWTAEPVQEDAVRQLVAEAKIHRFKYLFPYVSYRKADGSFSQSYRYATEFVTEFRKSATDKELLAWVGIPLPNYYGLGVPGWVDLSDIQTRRQIVDFIEQLVRQANFDGVHINAETVWGGDENFLALLDEVRAALGKEYKISIAGSQWMPPFLRWLPGIGKFRWDDHYYQALGKCAFCDLDLRTPITTTAEKVAALANPLTG